MRSIAPLIIAALLPVDSILARDPAGLPRNLGGGLERLVAWHLTEGGATPPAKRQARLLSTEPAARLAQLDTTATLVTVDVRLDGNRSLAQVRATLEALGCSVLGAFDATRAGSIISVRLPLSRALQAAKSPGIKSLTLAHRPRPRRGRALTQGAAILKATALNALGHTGSGITIGVISDSYNVTTPAAAADIATGDLPASPHEVYVLQEGNPEVDTDEGRAMLQIIHDLAPGAKLAFATCGETQATFAANIRALRTDPAVLADVLVDDIAFLEEPYFSDGPIAQAVEDVVTSSTLAGRPVAYYTAAGNDGTVGLNDEFRPISNADARARRPKHNLRLTSVPAELTAGGFHNFGDAERPILAQRIKVTGDSTDLIFQWDDPFIPDENRPDWITTDYNVLVFSTAGVYLGSLSGVEDNRATGQAVETVTLPAGARGAARTYQIAITRRTTPAPQAVRLRYVAYTSGAFESVPFQRQVPTIYGHSAARGGDAVAAYHYNDLTAPADFSSTGPVTICFDREGRRLAVPEVRQQPTIAATDNVDTTFFPPGNDTDGNGLPNFSGTSAAAPHVAAIAALLLEAKGGPGSLSSAQLRAALQSSAREHDLDPFFAQATVTTPRGVVTLQARGDETNNSSMDPRFFRLTYQGDALDRVTQVVIDLTPTPLVFDASAARGLPFRAGAFSGVTARDFSGAVGGNLRRVLTVKLRNQKFAPGASLEFGVDRDLLASRAGGNSADLLAGATVTVTTLENGLPVVSSGLFRNVRGKGYSPADGFGLLDAAGALQEFTP